MKNDIKRVHQLQDKLFAANKEIERHERRAQKSKGPADGRAFAKGVRLGTAILAQEARTGAIEAEQIVEANRELDKIGHLTGFGDAKGLFAEDARVKRERFGSST